eukprot:TRINITY_DN4416_c0_g3_i1.p1 TRINITY_DN4416_c0_g3~~TRINITY_DN4416_c0_g3_i1.p1  ORF type:complete len:379 (+),score=83.74 TRINITY_DN4416_c0_g3_i1:66-1139(+)
MMRQHNLASDSSNIPSSSLHLLLEATQGDGQPSRISPPPSHYANTGHGVPSATASPEKCRNRECSNPRGQPGKPRSIYCSSRCQSREQNLRQGRIKNVRRRTKKIREKEMGASYGGYSNHVSEPAPGHYKGDGRDTQYAHSYAPHAPAHAHTGANHTHGGHFAEQRAPFGSYGAGGGGANDAVSMQRYGRDPLDCMQRTLSDPARCRPSLETTMASGGAMDMGGMERQHGMQRQPVMWGGAYSHSSPQFSGYGGMSGGGGGGGEGEHMKAYAMDSMRDHSAPPQRGGMKRGGMEVSPVLPPLRIPEGMSEECSEERGADESNCGMDVEDGEGPPPFLLPRVHMDPDNMLGRSRSNPY